ncbi:MAG: hypothetical protein KAH03_05190 [Cocleimonas sp.]|nr:hypothetical protein [Cocleimonas sp.]
MNNLKGAVWISKEEDRRDALRLRVHTTGVKAFWNRDDQEGTQPPQRLTFLTLPLYLRERGLSVLLYLASIPSLFASWFKPKSLFGALLLVAFLVIGIGLFAIAIISGSMYYYLSQPVDQQQLQSYLKQHRQSIAISLHDESNHLIGALPPLVNDYNNETGALYVKNVPPLYWNLTKALSDKTLSFTQQDPSFWSLYKKIIRLQNASYKGVNLTAPYQLGAQGDALIMRIAKGLKGNYANKNTQSQSLIERFDKTKKTLQVARHLYPYLAQNNGEEFKRWSAMHIPLFSAKEDIYGLAAISETLFGKSPEQLNTGQQALLATAYYQQTNMSLLFSMHPKPRQNTWKRLLKQTETVATRIYKQIQPHTLRRILADLEAMKLAPAMTISARWLKFIEKREKQKETPLRYQHLLQRSELTLGKIKTSLHQNLQKVNADLKENTLITDVKISVPILKNQQLDHALEIAFNTTHRFYPKLFNKRLGESVDNNGALISLNIANEEGSIIRSYQRGLSEKRIIAGLSTLAISSLLLSRNDTPSTRYCNKSYTGIRNTSEPIRDGIGSCKTLSRKGYSFSLQQSIQQGKVLSLLYALTQSHKLSSADLTKLYKHFSLSKNTGANISTNTNKLAYELSVGSVESTPQNVHQMIHAITRHLYGIPYDNNPAMIHTLQMNRLLSTEGKHKIEYTSRRGGKSSSNDLEQYLSNENSRRYMKSLFTISSAKKNNPLKFLRSVEKKYGVNFLLVKSATSKTSSGNTKDKWLVGSLRLKQRIYSFSIMIGSNDSRGLGKNISHQQLMLPIMNSMIESLQQ